MSFFNSFSEFLELLLFGSNPKNVKKRDLHKLEVDLKSYSPCILKNHLVMPAFGQGLFILYQNTNPLLKILNETILNETSAVASNYIDLLISTGLTYEDCLLIKSFEFENRKDLVRTAESEKKEYDKQRADLEKVLKSISASNQMQQIELIISKLMQLHDICSFDYVSFLRIFDPLFSTEVPDYKPNLNPVELKPLEQKLLDFYYVTKDFKPTAAMGNALILLAEQKKASPLSQTEKDAVLTNLKRVASILTRIVTPENVYKLLCIIKDDPQCKAGSNKYEVPYIEEFVKQKKQMFMADEQRIQNELKDERLSEDLNKLFNGKELLHLEGYNNENNEILQRTSAQMFLWTTPLQILKSFMKYYFTPGVITLLNDIVVEGLFANVNSQTAFSNSVYSCSEILARIEKFEQSFDKGKENDFSNITKLAMSSKTNPDLQKQLLQKMAGLNIDVKNELHSDMTNFSKLTHAISDLFVDAKKGSPENVSNIKMILFSTRNKEHTGFLESHFSNWRNFIEIMKNYVIFTDKE